MSQKLVVITGAARGIGLEFCKVFKERGEQVIGACRQASAELRQLACECIEGIDVTDLGSLYALKHALGERRIDILINNAGVLHEESLERMHWDHLQQQLDVNAVGPLRVTHSLLDHLQRGSKVALVSSRMGSIADNGSGGYYGYRMSKAALNAAGKSLAIDLKPRGIAVALLHPGYVQTDMTGHHGDITPDIAAARLAQRIDELDLANSGSFWHCNGQLLDW